MHTVDSNHGTLDAPELLTRPVTAAPAPLPPWAQICIRGFVERPAKEDNRSDNTSMSRHRRKKAASVRELRKRFRPCLCDVRSRPRTFPAFRHTHTVPALGALHTPTAAGASPARAVHAP